MQGNSVCVTGNLTKDPDIRFTNKGVCMATFAIARSWSVSDPANPEAEPVKHAEFFDVAVFGPVAENVQRSLHKGDRVTVDGILRQRRWQTEDGANRSRVEILADEVSPSLRFAYATLTKTAGRDAAEVAPATATSSDTMPEPAAPELELEPAGL